MATQENPTTRTEGRTGLPPARQDQVRILIADDDWQLRRHVREAFVHDRWFMVVGEIAKARDVTSACLAHSPDIVFFGLLDHSERGAPSAIAALRRTVRAAPLVDVIALVAGNAAETFLGPLRAGARGILLRDAPAATLQEAVGEVMAGSPAIDPRLIGPVFDYLAERPDPVAGTRLDPDVLLALSRREGEVLQLLARGYRNEKIAGELGVHVGTVKTHLRSIYRKLAVDDRTSAVLAAFQLRLPEAA